MTRIPSMLQGLPDDLFDTDFTYARNLKVRNQGSADFYRLSTDPFPTPDAGINWATLVDTDTGDKWEWTGTDWIKTHVRALALPVDYFMEVASGNIPGLIDVTQEARSVALVQDEFQTLWDHIGNKKYLSADTQLYASSSSASDTSRIRVEGLNDQYELGITQVTLTSQTPVAIPGEFFRVREAFVDQGAALQGEVYIQESGTTTDGIPDDLTLVQSKIPLEPLENGDFTSSGMSHNGFFTVPAGFDVHLLRLIPGTAKGDNIQYSVWKREFGEQAWTNLFTGFAYSGPGPITIANRSRIQEKADLELRAYSGEPLGSFSAQLQFILREK